MSILIADTTREERQKIVKDAIALSSLDSRPPTENAMMLYEKYIEGKIELKNVTDILIATYGTANA